MDELRKGLLAPFNIKIVLCYNFIRFRRRDGMTDHTDGETIQSSWAYDKNDQALYVMQDGKVMRALGTTA